METIIAYRALADIKESSDAILTNAEMQRLAQGMSNNWETAQRLRYTYFLKIPEIGVEQAYETYALPAGGKITEVIRDGAAIKRHLAAGDVSESFRRIEPGLDVYLSTISQYATTFEEAHRLQFELSSTSGLKVQLKQQADGLSSILLSEKSCSEVIKGYYELRYFENEYLLNLQKPSISELNLAASRLSQSIDACDVSMDKKEAAVSILDEYLRVAQEIQNTTVGLSEKQSRLDALNRSIEPVLIELLVLVDAEVGHAGIQIENTRHRATTMLIVGIVVGLVIAIAVAFILHSMVTRKIINLTTVAAQFQEGNLDARMQIESMDELGELSNTFNHMADELQNLTVELREQANRDSLTGLFNRRYQDEILPLELDRAARIGKPISMVMLDLDLFKEINDRHGHAVGDRILMEFGKILGRKTRSGDVPCRFGGDEFIVLLPGATAHDALSCVSHWREKFEAVQIVSRGERVTTTFSTGIVQWRPGETPQELFIRLDAALYNAKNAGRNCVHVDDVSIDEGDCGH